MSEYTGMWSIEYTEADMERARVKARRRELRGRAMGDVILRYGAWRRRRMLMNMSRRVQADLDGVEYAG